MPARMSVATIDSPEFIKINPLEKSPLISECEVKVLYLGENRNRSLITKEIAVQMAQSLPGCPIVGYYIEKKEDFGDHGEQMIIDGEGIKFNKLTKPYGFIAPDAIPWFQKFEDTDEFGNTIIREYLMVKGFLWTGQFEECQRVLDKGNPQSMELDEKTLKGHWSTDVNRGIDFFIINDAIFSKLCILGEDVEPCFEGASVTAPEVSSSFQKNKDFSRTLFTMIKELQELTFSLKNNEGGTSMEENVLETPVVEGAEGATPVEPEATPEIFSAEPDKTDSEITPEIDTNIEEFKKNDDEKEEESEVEEKKDEEEEEPKKNHSLEADYALVKQELEELKVSFAELQKQNEELSQFKAAAEDEKKTELINSFYMLSDEDKKDVMENKAKYSLDDIEAKLSVICVRKKVNFNLDENTEEVKDAQPETIFNLAEEESSLPAWLKAVEDRRNRNI